MITRGNTVKMLRRHLAAIALLEWHGPQVEHRRLFDHYAKCLGENTRPPMMPANEFAQLIERIDQLQAAYRVVGSIR